MFKLLKSIFTDNTNSHTSEKMTDLRRRIVETSSEENWFRSSFVSQDDLDNPDECDDYSKYPYLVGCSIRDAIIKEFLIDKGYLSKLTLKHKQLIYKDDYGDSVFEDWYREVKKFTEKRIIRYICVLER